MHGVIRMVNFTLFNIIEFIQIFWNMVVQKGSPLVRIDDTRFRSDVAQQEEESVSKG